MKLAIIDTCYAGFLETLPNPTSYAEGLRDALSRRFGTFDAYSRNLRMLGWDAVDILANHDELQRTYAREVSIHPAIAGTRDGIVLNQIGRMKPDVIFMQDLSFFSVPQLEALKDEGYILAGQLSCRFDNDEILKQFDAIFTSFPFYVERFERLGVSGVFLPLAFDPVILETVQIPSVRTHAVSFVGGYGRHWQTRDLFVKLAEETPIQFWGYGYEDAPEVVRKKWMGHAWGVEMYEIYLRSHIVVNRHGGISRGLANNLRLFEATGCAALLMTEDSPNIGDYFGADECVTYASPQDLVEKIHRYLAHPQELQRIAASGQQRTLSSHTYMQRMPIVSQALKEALQKKAA